MRLVKQIIFASLLLFACSIIGFGQSPTQIKKKCPNTSVYSIVQITGLGDINVQPCSGRSTIFTQNVTLPSGVTGSGLTGTPNVLVKGTVQTFTDIANTSNIFNMILTPSATVGTLTAGDCSTSITSCLSLTQSTNTSNLYGTTVGVGDLSVTGNGTAINLVDSTKTVSVVATGSTAVFSTAGVINHLYNRTITAAGTVGAQTINKPAGTVNVAAANASIVITNSTVTTSSIPFVVLRTADATCTFVKSAVPTANTLTITLNANCTAETSVGFIITN